MGRRKLAKPLAPGAAARGGAELTAGNADAESALGDERCSKEFPMMESMCSEGSVLWMECGRSRMGSASWRVWEVGLTQNELDLVFLQEVPCEEVGWQQKDVQNWTFLHHRWEDAWRGHAVGFRRNAWIVMRHKQSYSALVEHRMVDRSGPFHVVSRQTACLSNTHKRWRVCSSSCRHKFDSVCSCRCECRDTVDLG